MSTILVEKNNGVTRVTLNKPPLNVLDIAMMDELDAALVPLKGDAATKVIVLAAQGKAFSAGVDIADHTPERVESMIEKFHAIFRTMWSLDQPIVGAVQGAALGGGCELAIACDFIVASEKAKFGQPEIKVGVFAPIATLLLPRLIGRMKANELLLTGDTVDAREAERIGLVNVVAPLESFDSAVNAFVGRLTSLSGAVLKHAKRAIGIGIENGLTEIERYYLNDLMRSEDATEGLNAFMAKRNPVWKDK
ncbi:MAG: enoyl-CoA hydratase/isomerase family protein [Chloroflexi bacterium]|nr:enoyl-CoA hydratase/isomerase family protein [Chloroflexota bacterium]